MNIVATRKCLFQLRLGCRGPELLEGLPPPASCFQPAGSKHSRAVELAKQAGDSHPHQLLQPSKVQEKKKKGTLDGVEEGNKDLGPGGTGQVDFSS